MTRMPTFEEIEADFKRGVRAAEQRIEHPFRRDAAPQTPATTPATMAAAPAPARPKENTMNLTVLEDDVKADLTDGVAWLKGMVGRLEQAAPGIIANSDALANTTLGKFAQIAAGKFLPPEVEAELLALAGRYFGTFGQPAQAPVAPVQAQQGAPAQ